MKIDSLDLGGPIRFGGKLFDGLVEVHEFKYPKPGHRFIVRAWYDPITFEKIGILYSEARKIARKIADSVEELANREITDFPSRSEIKDTVRDNLDDHKEGR